MSDVKFIDNSKEVLSDFEKAKRKALEAIGMAAVGHAVKKITSAHAVDTGRLRNSITFATKENEGTSFSYNDDKGGNYSDQRGSGAGDDDVFVGTNVEYAEGIELGTHRKAGAVHFLQDAVANHSSEYKKLAEDAMKNA